MSKLIIGFILGLVVSAVGFSGIARLSVLDGPPGFGGPATTGRPVTGRRLVDRLEIPPRPGEFELSVANGNLRGDAQRVAGLLELPPKVNVGVDAVRLARRRVAPVPVGAWRAQEPRGRRPLQGLAANERAPEMRRVHRLDDRLKPRIGQLHQADAAVVPLGREHRHALVALGLKITTITIH